MNLNIFDTPAANPPYGAQTGAWPGKLVRHGNGIALFLRGNEIWNSCARELLKA